MFKKCKLNESEKTCLRLFKTCILLISNGKLGAETEVHVSERETQT